MEKSDIVEKGTYIINEQNHNLSDFKIELFFEFFDQECEVLFMHLASLDAEPQMTLLIETVNHIVTLDESNRDWLKREVWNHYLICIKTTDYGMISYDGFTSNMDANMAYFKVFGPEDATKQMQLHQIWTDLNFTKSSYFNIEFSCPWESEHGIHIGVKDGKFESIF